MLLLIDASPEDKVLRALRGVLGSFGERLRQDDRAQVEHFGRWALRRAQFALWYEMNAREQVRHVMRQMRNRLASTWEGLLRHNKQETSSEREIEMRVGRDVLSAFLWAAAGYRPKPYPGPVAVLLSEDLLEHGDHLARAWQRLAKKAAVHSLKGSHLECITAHVDALAETIDHCLQNLIPRS